MLKRQTCPCATLFATNTTWNGLDIFRFCGGQSWTWTGFSPSSPGFSFCLSFRHSQLLLTTNLWSFVTLELRGRACGARLNVKKRMRLLCFYRTHSTSKMLWISSLDREFRKITPNINQQMHLYNFYLKRFKTHKTIPTCFDLFRSSSGSSSFLAKVIKYSRFGSFL